MIPLSLRSHLLHALLFFSSALALSHTENLVASTALKLYVTLYLFFLLPYFIIRQVWKKDWHVVDIFLVGVGVYFFLFVPFFYIITKIGITSLTLPNILLFLALVILLSYSTVLFNKNFQYKTPLVTPSRPGYPELLVLFFLAGFLLLHAIHFHYYHFIPEWDSYTDILNIENNITTKTFHQEYRAFFQASASILSILLNANPYSLFIFFFIPLQGSMFLVVYRLFQRYQYTHLPSQTAIYFLLLSIPVLNMEIDMVRPQNILILTLPLIFYLSTLITKERLPLAFLTLCIITVAGIFYHEFFWFFFLLLPILYPIDPAATSYLLKYRKLRWSFVILTGIILLALLYISPTLWNFTLRTLISISDISAWRWWFLDTYNNSANTNTQVGWSGPLNIVKYYVYYISIATLGILFLFIAKLREIKLTYSEHRWIFYSAALLATWFTFAEILPRLGSIFIPERFWIFFDLTVLFSFLLLILTLQQKLSKYTLLFIVFAGTIGIGGSIYIANAKKSLTTPDEYATALWLKDHTEYDALIISQAGNSPLINNFAKRELYTPKEIFFLDKESIPLADSGRAERIEKIIKRLEQNPNSQTKHIVAQLRSAIKQEQDLKKRPLYVLYSEQKFENLYTTREWYQRQNYYGASLQKFDKHLKQVYKNNGISIWKIR